MATTPTTRVHPARQYLRDLPDVLQNIGIELRNVRGAASNLLPFMWRVEAEQLIENAGFEMFTYACEQSQRRADWVPAERVPPPSA